VPSCTKLPTLPCPAPSRPEVRSGKDAYRTDVSDRTLFDVYLRPWKRYAEVGGRGVMASHQETNGVPNHANTKLLTSVWRGLFGANDSFVASDDGDIGQLTKCEFYSLPVPGVDRAD
jgi:beta-glucosidase